MHMEGVQMHLYLADRMVRLRVTEQQFFRTAHMWRFNRDAEINADVLAYKIGGIIPLYVQEFVKDIQQKEVSNAVQTVS